MSRVTVEYVGPFAGEVHVNLASGAQATQERRLDVDVDEAKALLEQPDNWQAVKAASSKPKEA